MISWNLGYWTTGAPYRTIANREGQWEWLARLQPDIALMQECRPEDPCRRVPSDLWAEYEVIGRIPDGWRACSVVLARRSLDPRPAHRNGPLLEFLSGYLALAEVTLPGGTETLVASVHTPARMIEDESIPAADRARAARPESGEVWHNDVAVAGLEPMASVAQSFLIGGDFNTCRAFDEPKWAPTPSCAAWFERRAVHGWCESLRKFWPEEVRTYMKDGTDPYELDHVFTDRGLHDLLERCEVLEMPAGLSDHAPLLAEFEL